MASLGARVAPARARAPRSSASRSRVARRATARDDDDAGRRRRATRVRDGRRRTTFRERNGFDWTANAVERAERMKRERNEADWGERAARGGETATSEGGETWRYAETADEYEYRGAWLALHRQPGESTRDEAFEEKVRAMKAVSKRLKEANMATSDFEPGGESYENFLGEHVLRHVTLARRLSEWRTNFLIRFAREPEYADMPSTVRDLEMEWIALGFKIRAIEKI